MIPERETICAVRRRLDDEPDWSEVEVDRDVLLELLALAEREVERREQRTVKIRTSKKVP